MSGGSTSSIEGLVDATFAAAARDDWQAVIDHCSQVLDIEPEHDTALRFLSLAKSRLVTEAVEEPTQRDERRQLTVMFADIVESTAMTQVLEPDQMRTVLKRYQMVCSDAIAEWDGFIGKWTGDGLMAYFGFPIPHEDSAYRAAMAGLTMLDRLDAINPAFESEYGVRLDTRVGIHTGLVVVADMGAGDWVHRSDVVGETPSIAARLEHLAPTGGVVISDSTHDLVRGFLELEPLGPHELKGIRRAVDVYRVIAPTDVVTRYEAWGGGSGPLIGRSDQLGRVVDAIADSGGDDGALVTVMGEAGIGKTRLIDEVRQRLDTYRVIVCPCSEVASSEPLGPFHRTLMSAAGVRVGTDPDEARDRIAALLAPYAQDPIALARLTLGLGFGAPPDLVLPPQTPEQDLRDIAGLYFDWFARFGAARSVVLVIDDAHWIDPTSRDLVLRLRSEAPQVPIVVATRPDEDAATDLVDAATTVVELEPLTTEQIEELLAAMVTEEHHASVRAAAERSDGVPLFAEELGRVLTREGDVSLAEIPNTLHDLLTIRLDALSNAKETAQVAATIGRDFDVAVLEHLVGADVVERDLPVLTSAGIVDSMATADRRRFRHSLLADAAYDSQLLDRKQDVHLQVADALTTAFPELAKASPHEVAIHLEGGGRHADAAGSWLQAGMTTAARGAHLEATDHFGRGLSALGRVEEGPLALQLELGLQLGQGASVASTAGYGHELVETAFARAQELCRVLGNPPELFFAVWGSWTYSLVRGNYDAALELAERLAAMAGSVEDPALSIEAEAALGITLFYRGELTLAAERLDAAVEQYRSTPVVNPAQQFQHPAVASLANAALVRWLLGDDAAARANIDAAVELAESCEPQLRMFARGYAATFGGALGSLLSDGPFGLRHAQEAIDVCDEFGSQVFLAGGEMYKGFSQFLIGETDEGRQRLDAAAQWYLLTGARLMRPYHLACVARTRVAAGDDAGALDALDEAVEVAEANGERAFLPLVLELRARTRFDARHDEAGADLEAALDLARGTGDVVTQLRSLMALHDRTGADVSGALGELLPQLDRSESLPGLDDARRLVG